MNRKHSDINETKGGNTSKGDRVEDLQFIVKSVLWKESKEGGTIPCGPTGKETSNVNLNVVRINICKNNGDDLKNHTINKLNLNDIVDNIIWNYTFHKVYLF